MAAFVSLTVLILAVIYFIWLLKMCDKDDDQKENAKNKIVNGISMSIAISIIIAVVIFVIYLIWVVWNWCGGAMVIEADSVGEALLWFAISIVMLLYFLGFFIRK